MLEAFLLHEVTLTQTNPFQKHKHHYYTRITLASLMNDPRKTNVPKQIRMVNNVDNSINVTTNETTSIVRIQLAILNNKCTQFIFIPKKQIQNNLLTVW